MAEWLSREGCAKSNWRSVTNVVFQRLILSSILCNTCINDLKDEVGCTLSKAAGGKKKSGRNVNALIGCDAV